MCDAAAVLYLSGWYRIYPHILPVVWFAFALCLISFVGSLFLPESPRWLLSQGRQQDAINAIKRIAKFNRTELCDFELRKDDKEEVESVSGTTKSFWTFKLILNVGLITIVWVVASFNYYLIGLYLKYIGGNIFVNTSIACFSELAAYAASGAVMNKLGYKISFVGSFSLAAAGGACIGFVSNESSAIVVFVLIAKFGISFAFNCAFLATP